MRRESSGIPYQTLHACRLKQGKVCGNISLSRERSLNFTRLKLILRWSTICIYILYDTCVGGSKLDGLWRIEHGRENIGVNFGSLSGVLQVSLEVTSVTTYHTRHLYDGVLLVLYVGSLLCTVATRARHLNHAPPDRRIRSCKCTQKWMFYLFATILILLYSATFPAAILSSPMTFTITEQYFQSEY